MISILIIIIRIYELAMILHIILNYLIPAKERNNNKFFQFVDSITEPVLKPVRQKIARFFPAIMRFRIDFSPIIIFIALSFFEGVLKIIFY